MKHYYEDVQGWFSIVDARFYNLLVEDLIPQKAKVVEVGSWMGRSLSCLLVEAKNSGKDIEVISVDTFKGSPDFTYVDAQGNSVDDPGDVEGACRKAADLAGYPYRIIRSTSVEAAKTFEDGSIDAVFIDGDHAEPAVTDDILAWSEKVKIGGYIAGHDVREPGVRASVEKLFGIEVLGLNIVGECWFMRRVE